MIIQLMNNDTVVYSYDTETKKINISSDTLRKQLEAGVTIPQNSRKEFNDRKIIKLGADDAALVHSAFSDFFVPKLNQAVFHWRIVEAK